ncbi:DoxX family protein [Actinokineospora auranticolor]|uniref:Putative membrane protein YphA (DoxX/SURF4 family) n=1 Tax=Actinokineospora auranticolor TaxID=155976 RepID=A0A2S6GNH5_9PSEU|nr:DoxX family protein [Actinokineospora auranticolor]PPK66778.1 putative membrane protein YphA (DoxX/SURF4 family) [Actinokineospora auranticolor]
MSLLRNVETRWAPVERALGQYAPTALRISLGLVFVWFGVLKVTGESPVAELLGATVPWVDQGFLVPALGWVEVVLGLALLVGKPRKLALVAVALHLTGTFLTFIQAPGQVMTDGNPLLLNTSGEFVLKNLVLITGALVLLAHRPQDYKLRDETPRS